MRVSENSVQTPELQQFLELFMATSRQRLATVQQERDLLDIRTTIFSDLKSNLNKLKRLADDFTQAGSLSPFSAKTATISNEDVLAVTAGAGAAAINHTIHIDQLARPHSVISNRYSSNGTELSAAHAGSKNFSISIDGTSYDVAVEIEAGATNEDVLDSISRAISSVSDLSATGSRVFDTDDTVRFSIASEETGTRNKMTFTDTDGLLASLGVTSASAATDTTGGYVYADLGGGELDAKLTVDGISVVRSSNSLSNVIAGVTLELRGTQDPTDASVSVGIEVDTKAIRERVDKFLESYNEAITYLRAKTDIDIGAQTRQPLAGDFTYSNLLQRIRFQAFSPVTSPSDPDLFALSQIGITSSETGTLSVTDVNRFEEKIAANIDAVESLFNSSDGVGTRMEKLLDGYTKATGIIQASQDTVKERIDYMELRLDRMQDFMDMERGNLIEKFGKLRQASQMQTDLMATLNAIYGAGI